MRFVVPVEQDLHGDGLEPVLHRLDKLFEDDWRTRQAEIAGCLCALRRGHRALRALIARHSMDGEEARLQGAQSFLITHNDHYGIRVNLWFPQTKLAMVNPRYRKYLSIGELHNHDFDFFTLCLSGPGYTSRFYRDRCFSPWRGAGETLDLEALGSVCLAGEAVMLVEHSQDYHAQAWPESFTTTLNLIPNEGPELRVQYVVDEDSLAIRDVIRGGG